MQVNELKEYLLDNNLCEDVLTALGCGHVRNRGEYISASNPDGNNTQAIVLYLSENLNCIDYTRQLSKTKRATDIFDLVAYFRDCTFPEAMKWVCDAVGLDYYQEPQDIPESLKILRFLREMSAGNEEEDNEPVKPIPEEILGYYLPYPNKMFEDDGIDLEIQQEFEVGYDAQTNYITIPIRDSLGSFCGVKGRYFGEPDEYHTKYTYIEKCNKSKILYGYWQNKIYIKQSKFLYILESEKAVQQLATIGVRSCVSTGGKTISKYQVEEIIRTGCTPILALDKDVEEDELKNIASMFMDGIDVYAIIDKDNILDEKESPSDNPKKWSYLIKNNIYKISKGGDTNGYDRK